MSEEEEEAEQPLYRLETQKVKVHWPGTKKDAVTESRTYMINTGQERKKRRSKWVHVTVGGFSLGEIGQIGRGLYFVCVI